MKPKCAVCAHGKAQRKCPRHDNTLICSSCCASERGDACGACPHYASSNTYRAERNARQNFADTGDYQWHRMRKTEGELIPKIVQYTKERFSPAIMVDAWD